MTDELPVPQLVSERVGKKYKVTATVNGKAVFLDTLDPAIAAHRAKFARAVTGLCQGASAVAIDQELLRIGTEPARDGTPSPAALQPEPLQAIPADVIAEAEDLLRDPELIGRVCDDV